MNTQIIKTKNNKLTPSQKVTKTLNRLFETTDPKDVVLCGGVIINKYIEDDNLKLSYKLGQDEIDLLVKDLPTLKSILTKSKNNFKITHFHDYAKKQADYHHADNFYGVIVDKETDVKIDIFDYQPFYPQRLLELTFNDHKMLARTIEDQAITKMQETYRILGTSCTPNALHPKQLPELYWLVTMSDKLVLQKLWSEHPLQNEMRHLFPFVFPNTFEEAYIKSIQWMYHHSEVVWRPETKDQTHPGKKPVCPECLEDSGITLHKEQ